MNNVIKTLKRRWYLFLTLVIFLGLVFYRQIIQPQTKKEETYIVKKQTLREVLTLSGEVDADEKTTLRFQTSGRLAWVGVKKGDYVKKYQTVATLDQKEVKKKLEKDLQSYLKSRADFDQSRDDNKVVVSDTVKRVLEKAQFDLNKAVLDVEIQNLSVEYSSLFSPIEGFVTRVASPYAGVNITPTQAEFEIVNPKSIYFTALADQTEVASLYEGMQAEIIFDAYPKESVVGAIESISFIPKEGETGTVYEVKLAFDNDNSSYKYRLGMTADVNFILKEARGVLAVPSTFLKKEKGKRYVLRKENGRKEKAYVEVGEEVEGLTEITSGLSQGDIIYD